MSPDQMKVTYWGGQHEVTNAQYWKFLNYLQDIDSLSSFELHKPKTANWKNDKSLTIGDSLSVYYDSLELFGNYPVVNITPLDAQAYVNWLNQIEPDSMVFYRLFTPNEWLELFNDHVDLDSSFAWGGTYWRNYDHAPLGNYAEFNQDQIRYNQLNDEVRWEYSDSIGYTSFVNGPMKVYSFNPNAWGAYNMSGNVAEIVGSYYEIENSWYCQTHGGSWHSPIFYLRKFAKETYKVPSPYVGFRVLKTKLVLYSE